MKYIVIQSKDLRQYLNNELDWTWTLKEAKRFKTRAEAKRFKSIKGIEGFDVLIEEFHRR